MVEEVACKLRHEKWKQLSVASHFLKVHFSDWWQLQYTANCIFRIGLFTPSRNFEWMRFFFVEKDTRLNIKNIANNRLDSLSVTTSGLWSASGTSMYKTVINLITREWLLTKIIHFHRDSSTLTLFSRRCIHYEEYFTVKLRNAEAWRIHIRETSECKWNK